MKRGDTERNTEDGTIRGDIDNAVLFVDSDGDKSRYLQNPDNTRQLHCLSHMCRYQAAIYIFNMNSYQIHSPHFAKSFSKHLIKQQVQISGRRLLEQKAYQIFVF